VESTEAVGTSAAWARFPCIAAFCRPSRRTPMATSKTKEPMDLDALFEHALKDMYYA
jgi:hypothetical protein